VNVREPPFEIDPMLKMPILETPRLLLRPLTLEDVGPLFALTTIPEVIRYVGNRPSASIDEARHYLETGALRDYAIHGYGRHAVVLKETGAVIGFHGFKVMAELGETELGYRLLPEHWGKGLASEAAKMLVEHAWRGLALSRIVSVIHPENEASKNVVRKLGMKMERRVRVSFVEECEVELYVLERVLERGGP
jgi:[ribosomal protein S5]-alanine N-acetyltransferase